MLVNPFFEAMEVGEGSVGSDPTWAEYWGNSPPWTGISQTWGQVMRYAPGWYQYGANDEVEFDKADLYPPMDNSAQLNHPASPQPGVAVRQNVGVLGGIVQRVFRGHLVKGRRVRVSGCYHVRANPDNLAGITVALKAETQVDTITDPTDWNTTVSIDIAAGVKHIISWSDVNVLDRGALELLNRAFDYHDGATNTLILGSSGVPAAAGSDTYLHYLDGTFNDDGNSDQILHSESQTGTGTTVYYFDVEVDVGDLNTAQDVGTIQEDVWIVVMPVDPADIGSMTGDAEIDLYSLQLSIVGDDENDGTGVTAAIAGAFGGGGPGFGGGGFSARWLMQYPIYAPAVCYLSTLGHSQDASNRTAGSWFVAAAAAPSVPLPGIQLNEATSGDLFAAKQTVWPPGSVITEVSLPNAVDGAGWNAGCDLRLFQSVLAGGGAMLDIATVAVSSSGTIGYFTVLRNRVGDYWDDSGNLAALTAADLWLELETPDHGSEDAIFVGGSLRGFIDSRWADLKRWDSS